MQRCARRPSAVRAVRTIRSLAGRLSRRLGPQHWWPADSPYEMMVGAILTQATSWHNVERAIGRLKRAGSLRPRGVLGISRRRLEALIRPAGYFRQKAQRLRCFTAWYVARHGGRAARLFRRPWRIVRQELLALDGIGPETADAMLLYAGEQPVFVVDTYTRRILARHRVVPPQAGYDEIQGLVMRAFGPRPRLFNEFHAQVVAIGKSFCHRRHPACEQCPLGRFSHTCEVIDGHR